MKNFLKENWFKVTLLLMVLLVAWIFYSALVIQPRNEREDVIAQEKARLMAEQLEKTDRQEKLGICLSESEYQVTSSHLWECSSLNRTPKSCGEIFSGAKSIYEAVANYISYFNLEGGRIQNASKFDEYAETCNCGLEKNRRDEIDSEKSERDNICFQLYK